MGGQELVAFDVETHKIQPGLLAPPLVCGSVAKANTSYICDKAQAREVFREISRDSILVGANIAYDLLVMAVDGFPVREIFRMYDEERVYDVQIAQALHELASGKLEKFTGYSLDDCVRKVLGRKDAKKHDRWRTSYALLENVPIDSWPEEARQYPVDDATNTLEVAKAQLRHNNLHNLAFQCYAAWALHLGAAWGFAVDQDRLSRLKEAAIAKQDDGKALFISLGILKENGKRDIKRLQEMVASAYGDNVPTTAKGGISYSRDALLESGNEYLMRFAEYSEADKVLTTYIPWLEKSGGAPINLKPRVLLASGRVSYGDVVQQLPRGMGIRECIVSRPGTVLCSCDYSGLELATHAQSCLWLLPKSANKLAKAINAGLKVHDLLGSQMLGVPYEEFLEKRLGGDRRCNNIRQAAKAANFGFPGGMSAPTFVLAKRKEDFRTGPYKGIRFCILMSGEEVCGREMVTSWGRREGLPPTCKKCIECAEILRNEWFKAWPENRDYFSYINTQVDKGYIEQHVSKRVRGGITFTSAANGFFQALAADGAKNALINVSREQYTKPSSPLFGSRTILFAHDELLVEMPEDSAHEAAARLSEVMVESMREYVPDVLIEAEPCLMRRWYKGAEPVFSDGRLVPWEPS